MNNENTTNDYEIKILDHDNNEMSLVWNDDVMVVIRPDEIDEIDWDEEELYPGSIVDNVEEYENVPVLAYTSHDDYVNNKKTEIFAKVDHDKRTITFVV